MPKTATIEHPPLMDLASVARRLGVNQRHIRRLVAERRIPRLKWGHLLRFDPSRSRPGSTAPAGGRAVGIIFDDLENH